MDHTPPVMSVQFAQVLTCVQTLTAGSSTGKDIPNSLQTALMLCVRKSMPCVGPVSDPQPHACLQGMTVACNLATAELGFGGVFTMVNDGKTVGPYPFVGASMV